MLIVLPVSFFLFPPWKLLLVFSLLRVLCSSIWRLCHQHVWLSSHLLSPRVMKQTLSISPRKLDYHGNVPQQVSSVVRGHQCVSGMLGDLSVCVFGSVFAVFLITVSMVMTAHRPYPQTAIPLVFIYVPSMLSQLKKKYYFFRGCLIKQT